MLTWDESVAMRLLVPFVSASNGAEQEREPYGNSPIHLFLTFPVEMFLFPESGAVPIA